MNNSSYFRICFGTEFSDEDDDEEDDDFAGRGDQSTAHESGDQTSRNLQEKPPIKSSMTTAIASAKVSFDRINGKSRDKDGVSCYT